MRIDINSDLGESFGAYIMGRDDQVIPLVTSVNVACGFHAGDPRVMHRTVRLARDAGVAIGAHPGHLDVYGFGRREIPLTPDEAHDLVLYQMGALAAFARAEGVRLSHVKPHGALYNMAAKDSALADGISAAVAAFDRELILFALAGSPLAAAGRAVGLRVAEEVFADRQYNPDGTLVSRQRPDAFVHDPLQAAQRIVRILTDGVVEAVDGSALSVHADTVCIHGDGPQAVEFTIALRAALLAQGVDLLAVGRAG